MSSGGPQVTRQTLAVLATLMDGPQEGLSGAQIARTTNLASGTLYPILARLEQAGWLSSKWETGDPHTLGRPRRRFYQVTGLGENGAKAEARKMNSVIGGLVFD
jgi:PadR family transcriptional regulator, regulatory protein PadR